MRNSVSVSDSVSFSVSVSVSVSVLVSVSVRRVILRVAVALAVARGALTRWFVSGVPHTYSTGALSRQLAGGCVGIPTASRGRESWLDALMDVILDIPGIGHQTSFNPEP